MLFQHFNAVIRTIYVYYSINIYQFLKKKNFFFIAVKFLEVIKPFCSILPEIAKPERKVCILNIFSVKSFTSAKFDRYYNGYLFQLENFH